MPPPPPPEKKSKKSKNAAKSADAETEGEQVSAAAGTATEETWETVDDEENQLDGEVETEPTADGKRTEEAMQLDEDAEVCLPPQISDQSTNMPFLAYGLAGVATPIHSNDWERCGYCLGRPIFVSCHVLLSTGQCTMSFWS